MRSRREAVLVLVLAVLTVPVAPALAGALVADAPAPLPVPVTALARADVDPVGVALRFAGAPDAALAPDAWVPRDADVTLLGSLARVHAAAEERALTRAEHAALVHAAARVPPAWASGAALVLDAMADALLAPRDAPSALAAAGRVARTVDGVRDAFVTSNDVDPFVFADPLGYVRLDSRWHDTRHDRVFAFNVDAGGNDTYVGNHAGAGLGSRGVMIVLDLDGDDAYVTRTSPNQLTAQGASAGGVLGLLVDVNGNDRYTATHTHPERPVTYQGGCWGTGLGVLIDHAGHDAYVANGSTQGGVQGAATSCTGVLVDLDGNDEYVAGDARAVAAQGATDVAGHGLLLDRWGDDAYTAVTVQKQGEGGFGGVGVLADLHGEDTYNGARADNQVESGVNVGHRTGGGARVDQTVPRSSESVVTFVYYAGSTDEDADGHPVMHFRRRDAHVNPNGSIGFSGDAPYAPLDRAFLGDPDDRERLEAVRVDAGAHCVLALVDSGINPYHLAFADDGFDAHAGIPGFPADAVPLNLSLDARGYDAAVAADAGAWARVEEGVLYTVPGTRIAGAISLGPLGGNHAGARRILDDSGHGTGAAGAALALAPACALVVVEAGDVLDALTWVAGEPWIDAVSVSINLPAGAYLPDLVANATRAIARSGKPVFVAAGNGLTGRDVPTPSVGVGSPFSGPGWVVSVGASAPWNDQSVWWGTYPVDVVSRGVDVRVPSWNSVDGSHAFDGSSAATPRVAGAAVHALHEARARVADAGLPAEGPLADGVLTRGEWEFTVLRSARPVDVATSGEECARPSVSDCVLARRWPVYMLPAAPGAEFLTQGYGVMDEGTRDAAARVLTGDAPAPVRAAADGWWRAVHLERESWWSAHDDNGVYVEF